MNRGEPDDVQPKEYEPHDSIRGDQSSSNLSPLPGKIANALVVIYEGLREFDLVENNRKVFACLIRFGVNLNHPEANIFIKKSTIASKLNVNEATVYRSLTTLEAAGLIVREAQKRVGANIKTIGYIRLTRRALVVLGLSRNRPTGATTAEQKAPADRGTSQAQRQAEARGKNTEDHLAPVQDVNNAPQQSLSENQPRRGLFEKIGGKTVPSDLAWLHHENSLKLSGLFKLMRAAREKGARLSDVVLHSRQALLELRGRELYAYLMTIIGLPIDHAHKAKDQQQQADIKAQRVAEEQRRLNTDAELRQLSGKSFLAPNGQCWTIEEGAFYVTSLDRPAGSVPFAMALDVAQDILAGHWPRHDGVQTNRSAPTTESRSVRFGGHMQTLKQALQATARTVCA